MNNLLIRKRFISMATILLMAGIISSKTYGQNSTTRSDFKKNFKNTLIAKAELWPNSTITSFADMKIDTFSESQEVANSATDTIVSRLLANNQALAALRPGKTMTQKYRNAVREVIGNGSSVPVGLHCMRSAYEGIMSGIDALGVEEEIISPNAKDACINFRNDWKKRFPKSKYEDLWYENATVYKNYAEFEAALEKYISTANPKTEEEQEKLYKEFIQKNVHIDVLDGSVFLTPRSNNRFHATFYPGRMETDSVSGYNRSYDGQPMIISFNREYITELFGKSNTKKISFIAVVNAGITAKVQEGSDEKISKMSREELLEYLTDGISLNINVLNWLKRLSHKGLINLGLARYFGKDFHNNPPKIEEINPVIRLLDVQSQRTM